MFERHHEPLLPRRDFALRMVRFAVLAAGIVIGSLFVGVLGYHLFEGMSWIDALVNAAMILGGMGPVSVLLTSAGKVFAALYALFSGLAFLVIIGVILAPVIHRFLHRFHLGVEPEEPDRRTSHRKS